MLAIKVTATPERIDVHGIIPLEATSTQTSDDSSGLLTTGQTSGCLTTDAYKYLIPFAFSVK